MAKVFENRVFEMLMAGFSPPEIARRLRTSLKAIENIMTANGWNNPENLRRSQDDSGDVSTSFTEVEGDLAEHIAVGNIHRVWENSIAQDVHADNISEGSVTQHQAALSITESQISDLGSYLTGITGEPLSDLSDVTISSIGGGELLKWNGSAWINNTLTEAGIAAIGHTHTESDITDLGNYAVVGHSHSASDITSGTLNDDRVAQSNVTQHQAALSITESQISDLSHYTDEDARDAIGTALVGGTDISVTPDDGANTITIAFTGSAGASSLDGLSDVSITTVATGHFLRYNGTNFVNTTITSGDLPSHTHTESDITDLQSYLLAGDNISVLTNDAGYITATLTNEEVQDIIGGMLSGNTETLISVTYQDGDGTIDFVVDDDLDNYDNTTSGFITDYTVTQADVTQHEAAIDHNALTNYAANQHRVWESSIAQNIHADNISEASVTQHQAALSITESQISDLGDYLLRDGSLAMLGNLNMSGNNIIGVVEVEPDGDDIAFGSLTFSDKSWQDGFQNYSFAGSDIRVRAVSTDAGTWGSAFTLDQVDLSNDPTEFENSWAIIRQTNEEGSGDGRLSIRYGTSNQPKSNTEIAYFTTAGAFLIDGNTAWHAGNDGASSGLDADLLDGNHASAFANASHTHTESDITDLGTYFEAGDSPSWTGTHIHTGEIRMHKSGQSTNHRLEIIPDYVDFRTDVLMRVTDDNFYGVLRFFSEKRDDSSDIEMLTLDGDAGVLIDGSMATVRRMGLGDVDVNLRMENDNQQYIFQVDGDASLGTTNDLVIFDDTNSNLFFRYRPTGTGLMYIPPFYNQTTGSSANVNVASTGLVRRSTSSLRYKEDISALTDEYFTSSTRQENSVSQILAKMQPLMYTHKGDGMRHIGFAAEDMHEILPELVTYDERGRPDWLQYDKLTTVLVAGWQAHEQQLKDIQQQMIDRYQENQDLIYDTRAELLKKIDAANDRIAVLEGKISV